MAYCTADNCPDVIHELTPENGVLVERKLPSRTENGFTVQEWDTTPMPIHRSCMVAGFHRLAQVEPEAPK